MLNTTWEQLAGKTVLSIGHADDDEEQPADPWYEARHRRGLPRRWWTLMFDRVAEVRDHRLFDVQKIPYGEQLLVAMLGAPRICGLPAAISSSLDEIITRSSLEGCLHVSCLGPRAMLARHSAAVSI